MQPWTLRLDPDTEEGSQSFGSIRHHQTRLRQSNAPNPIQQSNVDSKVESGLSTHLNLAQRDTVQVPQFPHRPPRYLFENTSMVFRILQAVIQFLDCTCAVALFKPVKEVGCGLISRIPLVPARTLPVWRGELLVEADVIYVSCGSW